MNYTAFYLAAQLLAGLVGIADHASLELPSSSAVCIIVSIKDVTVSCFSYGDIIGQIRPRLGQDEITGCALLATSRPMPKVEGKAGLTGLWHDAIRVGDATDKDEPRPIGKGAELVRAEPLGSSQSRVFDIIPADEAGYSEVSIAKRLGVTRENYGFGTRASGHVGCHAKIADFSDLIRRIGYSRRGSDSLRQDESWEDRDTLRWRMSCVRSLNQALEVDTLGIDLDFSNGEIAYLNPRTISSNQRILSDFDGVQASIISFESVISSAARSGSGKDSRYPSHNPVNAFISLLSLVAGLIVMSRALWHSASFWLIPLGFLGMVCGGAGLLCAVFWWTEML